MEFEKLIWILLALLAGFTLVYFLMKQLARSFLHGCRQLGDHMIKSFVTGLRKLETTDEEKPKSLPNMESLILPQVLKDFPDFDLAMTKNEVKDHLMEVYGGRAEFTVHNIALVEYRRNRVKRAVVFQAAVSWRGKKLLQKKLEIVLEFQCVDGKRNPAINCPNCGATLGFHDLECKYCGTRINDRRDQEWSFASVREIY